MVVGGGAVVDGAEEVDVVVDEAVAASADVVVVATEADSTGADPPEHADAIMVTAMKSAGEGICRWLDMVRP